jgi:hypothetical protein
MVKHITDNEVQQFVVDKQHCEIQIVGHIHTCDECKMKIEVYRSLITAIKQQPEPAFDFDLSALVLQQLPSPKQKAKIENDNLLVCVIIFIGTGFTGAALYSFRSYFKYFYDGIETILGVLIVVSAITVLTGLYIDMYKKYRKGMKVLDLN